MEAVDRTHSVPGSLEDITQGKNILTDTLCTMTESGESTGLLHGQRGTTMTTAEIENAGRGMEETMRLAAVLAAGGQGVDHRAEKCPQLQGIAWAGEEAGMSRCHGAVTVEGSGMSHTAAVK